MPKRFTASEKWSKEWFQTLKPKHKCFWQYLCDNCDCAGIWDPNYGLASYMIGEQVSREDLALYGERLELLPDGKIWIVGFVAFQYGELSDDCKPHAAVIKRLKSAGLFERVSKGLAKGILTLKDKEKEKEKSKIDGFEGSKKDVDDHDANLIYAAYPRKVARKLAMRAIIRAMEKTPAELLIVLTRQYAEARRGQDENFTPHPATWFNQERFNDAPETWKPRPSPEVKQENETPKWKKLEILKEHVSKFTAQNPHPDRWTQEQRDTLKKNREEIKKLEMEMVK